MLARPASLRDMEFVRRTRNAGRKMFTEHREYITPEEQYSWWREKSHDLTVFSLEDGERIGYALLTEREGKKWISLAVTPEYQGKGWGTEIYHRTRRRSPIFAAIRKDNPASLRAAQKAGYRQVSEDAEKVVMSQ